MQSQEAKMIYRLSTERMSMESGVANEGEEAVTVSELLIGVAMVVTTSMWPFIMFSAIG